MASDGDEPALPDNVRFRDRESIEQAILEGEFDGVVMWRFIQLQQKRQEQGHGIGTDEEDD